MPRAPGFTGCGVPRALLGLLFCLLLTAVGGSDAAAQAETRQLADAMEPVPVSVGFLLIDVHDIDGASQSMRVDFSVHLSWKDESLAGKWPRTHTLDVSETWVPDVLVLNDLSLSRKRRERVEVEPDGTVTWRQRYFGDIAVGMYLKDFPADRHTLDIRFVSAMDPPL